MGQHFKYMHKFTLETCVKSSLIKRTLSIEFLWNVFELQTLQVSLK